jgi:hypothetical protein
VAVLSMELDLEDEEINRELVKLQICLEKEKEKRMEKIKERKKDYEEREARSFLE